MWKTMFLFRFHGFHYENQICGYLYYDILYIDVNFEWDKNLWNQVSELDRLFLLSHFTWTSVYDMKMSV